VNDFHGWVTGNVATAIRHRVAASGAHVADFRVASTRRWNGRDGQPHESTSFLSVRCFGPLADNVASSLDVGQPVVVAGRLEVEENEREGTRYRDVVMLASGVGPNLAFGSTTFRRTVPARRPAAEPGPAAAPQQPGTPAAGPGRAPAA
jgi:single-strand DNA-binding protein